MLFAETDTVLGLILALATLVVGAITTIVMGYIAYLTVKLSKGQTVAAVHAAEAVAEAKDTRKALKNSADEVKETLATSSQGFNDRLENIATVTDNQLTNMAAKTNAKLDEGLKINRATHTLVNLKTSKQLRTIVEDKEEIYRLKPTPASLSALEGARRDLVEHLEQQAKVDAEYGEEAAKKMGTKPNPAGEGAT